MKRILTPLIAVLLAAAAFPAAAQKITDNGYRCVGYIKIKSDGTVQDASYRTVGHIKADGTVQDSSYRTIGHTANVLFEWAALWFFFKL